MDQATPEKPLTPRYIAPEADPTDDHSNINWRQSTLVAKHVFLRQESARYGLIPEDTPVWVYDTSITGGINQQREYLWPDTRDDEPHSDLTLMLWYISGSSWVRDQVVLPVTDDLMDEIFQEVLQEEARAVQPPPEDVDSFFAQRDAKKKKKKSKSAQETA